VLPSERRLRRSEDFRLAVRRGRRSAGRILVVHLVVPARPDDAAGPTAPAKVGFVVSRGVGGSVVRSRVTRRLRHVMAPRLDSLPAGALLVIRALPPAAAATSAELAVEIDRGLARLVPTAASSGASA
jgi:ribonuclease P protein component